MRTRTEADAKDGHLARECTDDVARHARILWCARSWADDDARGVQCLHFGNCDRVVAIDHDLRPKLRQQLHDIVAEAVVVVDEHREAGDSRRSAAGGSRGDVQCCRRGHR